MKRQSMFFVHDLEVLYPKNIPELRQLHVEASENDFRSEMERIIMNDSTIKGVLSLPCDAQA